LNKKSVDSNNIVDFVIFCNIVKEMVFKL
jgi:hypothetical protein